MVATLVAVGVLTTGVGVAVGGASVGGGLMVGRETVGAGVAVLVDVAVGFWATSVGVMKLLQPVKPTAKSPPVLVPKYRSGEEPA